MKNDLEGIAFDHYQRYSCSARLIEALGGIASVLEVGANRQRLLAQFLPQVRFVFSDLAPLPDAEEGFVQADATALPFLDAEFDATVCLDVIEHMPRKLRPRAIAEMARVSRRMVIVAFPVDRPWVHDAEARASSYWKHYFAMGYPWLEEHQEFGLVDGDEIDAALRGTGMKVLRFGHADVRVWAGLMGAHFTKERIPELQGLVAAADRLYNASVFPGDRGDACYREFFIGVHEDEGIERVRAASMFATQRDETAAAMLAGLADTLRPAVDRTLRAEAGWSETAEHARKVEASLNQALQRAEQAEAHVAKASEGWQIAAQRVREVEASLNQACEQWAASVGQVRELEASLDYAREQWAASAERVRKLEARSGELTQQLQEAIGRLEATAADREAIRSDNGQLRIHIAQLRHRQRRLLQAGVVTAAFVLGAVIYWFLRY